MRVCGGVVVQREREREVGRPEAAKDQKAL